MHASLGLLEKSWSVPAGGGVAAGPRNRVDGSTRETTAWQLQESVYLRTMAQAPELRGLVFRV